MNQFFSFHRFKMLVSMHWAQNKKRYGLSVLALIGLLVIRFLFFILIRDNHDNFQEVQLTTFLFSLFLVGSFYASQYFQELESKAKATNFLLVPASTFEKFLCSLSYTVIMFIMVLTAAHYFVDFLMLSISKSIYATDEGFGDETTINFFKIGFYMLRDDLRINGMLFFLAIQSAFLLGSVYFKKYSFLKTFITGFVIYCIVFGVTYISCNPPLPRWLEQILSILAMYVIAPCFWILTYYRLKQKQV